MSRQGTLLTRRIWGVIIIAAIIGTLLIALPTVIRGAVSSAQHLGEQANVVVIGPNGHNVAAHVRKQTFLIMGSGFPANTEVSLLMIQKGKAGAVTSDFSYRVKPAPPTTDGTGAFAVTYSTDRVVSRGVMGPDIATLWVTDADFNVYATAPLAMCDIGAEELAAWCSAPGVVPATE